MLASFWNLRDKFKLWVTRVMDFKSILRLSSFSRTFFGRRMMATRTYQQAIEKLNSLQSNAATLEAMRASGTGRMADYAIPEMKDYLRRIGYSPDDLNSLNVLHVTGTKGKGSTCAFADSLLRHAVPSWKVGLYTSPHLVAVRERIRIDGQPISEDDFAKFFFEVWDRLETNNTTEDPTTSSKPMYFKFVTLVAYHAFLSLKVDATILEVGVGGMYDSTNIVPKPIVAGVSALGIDHVAVLGKTLAEIGWQKGGIFKEGVPAFTVEQPEDGFKALKNQAHDRKASDFTVLPVMPELSTFKLGLAGVHQLQNATLAVHMTHRFLADRAPSLASPLPSAPSPLPDIFITALKNARWPGRCQRVPDPHQGSEKTTWFLDGAHTVESLKASAEWFFSPGVGLPEQASEDKSIKPITRPVRALIFNCTSGRAGYQFLETLHITGVTQETAYHQASSTSIDRPGLFDHVIFCANVTYADGHFKGDLTSLSIPPKDLENLTTQHELANAWSSLIPSFPSENIHVLPSIEHALQVVRGLEAVESHPHVDVLVTGSLHLVGGVIEVAEMGEVALRV